MPACSSRWHGGGRDGFRFVAAGVAGDDVGCGDRSGQGCASGVVQHGRVGLLEEPQVGAVAATWLGRVRRRSGGWPGLRRRCSRSRRPARLHQAWVRELDQRFPGSVRVFAPSETAAARAQLGSRRFKTDDRDCAALTYLARQGQGRPVADDPVDALRAAVRYRRGLVAERKVAQQRLHDQLNALCPGLSAPAGHGRALMVDSVDRAGGARLRGRLRRPAARGPFAAGRAPRTVVRQRRQLLGRAVEAVPAAPTATPRRAPSGWAAASPAGGAAAPTSPPSRPTRGAAGRHRRAGADHAARRRRDPRRRLRRVHLPIDRFPAPSTSTRPPGWRRRSYQSATINRAGRISRTGAGRTPRRADGHRLGPVAALRAVHRTRPPSCAPAGWRPIQARVALARHACRLAYRMLTPSSPSTNSATVKAGTRAER